MSFNDIVDCIKAGGNLPIIETGKIVGETSSNEPFIVSAIIWIGKGLMKLVVYLGNEAYPIFLIVAIGGFFIVMAGHKKLGYKITSGCILGYLSCRLIGEMLS